MPAIEVTTNVARNKIPADLPKTLAEILSKHFDRPSIYVACTIHPDTVMSWGGKDTPAAVVHIWSAGAGTIEKTKNKKLAATLCPHFQKGLGVPAERLFILFHQSNLESWAFKDSDVVNFGG